MHSTAAGAARTALKCNADNLILTHFSARLRDVSQAIEEARQVLGKTYGLEAASDGDRVRIDENGHASFAQVISEWLGATQTIASLKEYVEGKAMHSRKAIAVLTLLLCVSLMPLVSSTSGRAIPSCSSESGSAFPSQVPVDDGECVELSLGLLTPGDVYDIEILVIDDALDVLVFDEAGLQPYLLGQSYRSSYQQIPSTEFANGSYKFHWKVLSQFQRNPGQSSSII